jgi:murein DD-endopeptidase MepM/ murein hydrolase activator NlpD
MKPLSKQSAGFKIKYFISAFLAVLVFVCFNSIIYFSPLNKIFPETLEEELERVKNERTNTQKEIEKTKKAESEYMSQVNKVEVTLISALSELDSLNDRASTVKTEIDRLTIELVIKKKDLSDAEHTLTEKNSILSKRVSIIYKNRNQNVLELLFESDSFLKLFTNLKLMNLFAQQDLKVVKEVAEIRQETEDSKENIERLKLEEKSQKKNLDELVGEAEKKKREIEAIYIEKKNLLSRTRANKDSLIAMEKQLEAKEKEVTKKLEALRYGTAPGKIAFPAKGILTSGFGMRNSPLTGVNRLHSGIDIGASAGSPVIAAASGEVLQVSYMGGYGNAILIYHGGGLATLYAHLSGFAVEAGQKVKQGQIIGYVGSTGFTTGPHLHFEVRVNGAPVNPYKYF